MGPKYNWQGQTFYPVITRIPRLPAACTLVQVGVWEIGNLRVRGGWRERYFTPAFPRKASRDPFPCKLLYDDRPRECTWLLQARVSCLPLRLVLI